tara:strand:- start:926 stop:1093 length:168 start_codon:yes stop_codon:yes gene_type:complete
MVKDNKDDNWCHYSGMPSPSAYIISIEEKEIIETPSVNPYKKKTKVNKPKKKKKK